MQLTFWHHAAHIIFSFALTQVFFRISLSQIRYIFMYCFWWVGLSCLLNTIYILNSELSLICRLRVHFCIFLFFFFPFFFKIKNLLKSLFFLKHLTYFNKVSIYSCQFWQMDNLRHIKNKFFNKFLTLIKKEKKTIQKCVRVTCKLQTPYCLLHEFY